MGKGRQKRRQIKENGKESKVSKHKRKRKLQTVKKKSSR